ncbi:MAG: hypothetical protein AAF840_05010 [Bacteroidota bacterium]
MSVIKTYLLLFLCCFSCSLAAQKAVSEGTNTDAEPLTEQTEEAPEVKWGVNLEVTFISRFIWRGLRLGEYTSIQPSVTLSRGRFFTGIWASHALALTVPPGGPNTDYKEIVPYVGYGFQFSDKVSGTLMALGHYNPNAGGFFNYSRSGELVPLNNRVEIRTLLQAGNFDFLGAADVINDPTGNVTLYLEFGYSIPMAKDVKLRPLVSFTPTENYYTADGKADLTQIGFITTKSFKVTNQLSLTAKVDMVYNPDRDDFYSAFGLVSRF